MNNTINKRTLQALKSRLFIKDIAKIYDVSPSTVSRWSNTKKSIKTIKNYDDITQEVRSTVLKKKVKNKNSHKEKRERSLEYVEGKQLKKIEYDNGVGHIYYKFSSLIPELLRLKANHLIDYNIQTGINETMIFIQLKVISDEKIIHEEKLINTHAVKIHNYNTKTKEHERYLENLEDIINTSLATRYSNYNIIKILEVYMVEKFFDI